MESLAELILSLICVLAGLILMIGIAGLQLERKERRQILHLGLFTVSVGLWRFCDLEVASFLFPGMTRPIYFCCMLSLMLMPLFFTRFLYWQYEGKAQKTYQLLSMLFAAECVVLLALQLLNIRDLRTELVFIFSGILIAAIPVFLRSLMNLMTGKGHGADAIFDGMYILFALASVVDMLRFRRNISSRHLVMMISVTVIHLFVMCVIILRRAAERRERAWQLEAELAEERTRVMLSQIQPHFLFNSLGIIRELCHSDPAGAERATVIFSQYLRQNMDSLTINRPIPFRQELEHTRNYLTLEKLRFGDQLQVEYDISDWDFLLPALTLQPIAENAVRHGVRKRTDGGTIRISTLRSEDGIRILVRDNGPGFDPEKPLDDGRTHVGIENVRHRLETQCGGTLTIHSDIGQGTEVTLFLPANPEIGHDL